MNCDNVVMKGLMYCTLEHGNFTHYKEESIIDLEPGLFVIVLSAQILNGYYT